MMEDQFTGRLKRNKETTAGWLQEIMDVQLFLVEM